MFSTLSQRLHFKSLLQDLTLGSLNPFCVANIIQLLPYDSVRFKNTVVLLTAKSNVMIRIAATVS
jgi:hypothetical protein